MAIYVKPFHHKESGTLTYIVINKDDKKCAIIDSVLDYQESKIDTRFIDRVLGYIKSQGLFLEWVLDTHVHADHLTASFYLHEKTGSKTGISENHKIIQTKNNNKKTNISFLYSNYFKDGDLIFLGDIPVKIMETPGHTITCLTYVIENYIFCGDLLLMPEVGCGRCDFDEGNANSMYKSGQNILSFPGNYKVCIGHNYPEKGKRYRFSSSIKVQKESNVYFNCNDKLTFIKKRTERDLLLPKPKLYDIAIPYNLYRLLPLSVTLG